MSQVIFESLSGEAGNFFTLEINKQNIQGGRLRAAEVKIFQTVRAINNDM